MAQLHLEFIPRRRIPWLGISVLVITIAWGGVVGFNWFNLRASGLRQQAQLSTLDQTLKEKKRLVMQSQSNIDPAVEQRLKAQTKMVAALTYPWNRVLAMVEQAEAKDVAILTFVHDQSAHNTQLSVEGLDVAALISFVEQLNEGNPAGRWYMASYQVQSQNTPQTVRANIVER